MTCSTYYKHAYIYVDKFRFIIRLFTSSQRRFSWIKLGQIWSTLTIGRWEAQIWTWFAAIDVPAHIEEIRARSRPKQGDLWRKINLLTYYDVFDRYYGMCDSKPGFISHTALHKRYYTCIQKFITFIIIFTSSQRDIRFVKNGQNRSTLHCSGCVSRK